MGTAYYFLKNISQGLPIQLAWYLSNQISGAWPCLNIHRVSSTEGIPRSLEVVRNDFGGSKTVPFVKAPQS